MTNTDEIYDLIILGAGSAGLSAGIYAGRAKLKTLILEKHQIGGQTAITNEIANYPGFQKISGSELMEKMKNQAQGFGVEIECGKVTRADLLKPVKEIETEGKIYKSYAVILATGASPKHLGFQGEEEYIGRGVGYCATCDGFFFQGKDIFVIGGGYSAAEEALYLTKFGKKVTVIVRKEAFKCAKSIVDKVMAHPKIEVKFNTELKSVYGDNLLQGAVFFDNKTKQQWEYKVQPEDKNFGVFVFVGYKPNTEMFANQIKLDDAGYTITDNELRTSVKGVFAAGDMRQKNLRQIVTATADGAMAAVNAEKYITRYKEDNDIKIVEKTEAAKENQVQENSSKKIWLNQEMSQQVKNVFDKLKRKLTLAVIINPDEEKSKELVSFIKEIVALSDKLELLECISGKNPDLEEKVKAENIPMLAILDEEEKYTGVKFSGIPSGQEFNSLIFAIYNLAGEGQPISEELKKRVEAVKGKYKLQVAISLSCHFCPEAVIAAQRMAMLNTNIEAEMVDINMFSSLREKHQIMSVPAIVVNENQVHFGVRTIEGIVEILEKG